MPILRFLFASKYPPWPVQVLWKFLTWGMAATLIAAAATDDATSTAVDVFLYGLAAAFVFFGLFTKLGDG